MTDRETLVRTIALSYARNDLEPTSEATLNLYRKDAEHAADAVLALPQTGQRLKALARRNEFWAEMMKPLAQGD